MFREIDRVPQDSREGFKRSFEDSQFELHVWYERTHQKNVISFSGYLKSLASKFFSPKQYLKSGGITAFQLCFPVRSEEHALMWSLEEGWSAFLTSTGRPLDWPPEFTKTLFEQFKEAAESLDPSMRTFLISKISEWV